MSSPTAPRLVSVEKAKLIADLDQSVVDVILRLSSLGVKPDGIIDYCNRVALDEPAPAVVAGGAKPLVIQAYSFLSDKSICVDKFGMELSAAAAALETLKRDPEEGRRIVHKAVADHQAKRGSPKPIVVNLAGLPSSRGGPKTGGDGGKAELSELMRRNQALAGAYAFVAEEHGPPGPERFRVLLGGNLAVVGQNKACAVKAAALVRILGRRHQTLVKYVRGYIPGKALLPSDKIPPLIYDGIIAPDEKPPSDESKGQSTVG
ncbi:hypothetical protein [Penicillium digitatum polymycoviruses 1]|uniref:Uncharacterized protein n=1 Tax=Penicillium digitatum polymycoviruses 1 TaxID=2164101 RepID=A0A2R4SUG8_9VIRU|nr:hypothetical protein [Penicillium digitatum polymycoviruses 1]AVZ65986.1 hypothetical protein [Penicillium digitatum polymycoviruses 1]